MNLKESKTSSDTHDRSRTLVRFWSSTEYSGFLAGLIRELNASGARAEQCYQISEASYRSAKSTPARLFLRFRQYVAYPAQLIAVLGWQRVSRLRRVKASAPSESGAVGQRSTINDQQSTTNFCDSVAVVSTNTFYAPLIATYLHPNVVHLVYDLFPEAMIHSGKWTEGTLKVKVVRWITKQTLKRSKTNVFLGQRLMHYVESIHGPVENSAIIAVGADQSLFRLSPKQRRIVTGEVRIENDDEKVGIVDSEERLGRAESGDLKPEGSRTVKQRRIVTGEVRMKNGGEKDDSVVSGEFTSHQSPVTTQSSPTILYCGNFGNMHDSATLFQFWNQVAEVLTGEERVVNSDTSPSLSQLTSHQSPVTPHDSLLNKTTWLFCCSGPKRAALEAERAQLPADLQQQIQLGGGLSQEDWITTMESADVALVTMVPGSETVVMPSKTYSAMMAGQAILAVAPEDSDLVDVIKAADCGWFVEPGDVAGLERALEEISSDPDRLLEKREHAYEYAQAYLGQDALARDWMAVLGSEE